MSTSCFSDGVVSNEKTSVEGAAALRHLMQEESSRGLEEGAWEGKRGKIAPSASSPFTNKRRTEGKGKKSNGRQGERIGGVVSIESLETGPPEPEL